MTATVGQRIKKLREDAGISRAEMSRALGIRETRIQDIERGKQKLPSDLLTEISSFFGVDVEFILTGVMHAGEEKAKYEAHKGVGALSRDEEVLVEKYRQLKPGDRTLAQAMFDALDKPSMKKKGN